MVLPIPFSHPWQQAHCCASWESHRARRQRPWCVYGCGVELREMGNALHAEPVQKRKRKKKKKKSKQDCGLDAPKKWLVDLEIPSFSNANVYGCMDCAQRLEVDVLGLRGHRLLRAIRALEPKTIIQQAQEKKLIRLDETHSAYYTVQPWIELYKENVLAGSTTKLLQTLFADNVSTSHHHWRVLLCCLLLWDRTSKDRMELGVVRQVDLHLFFLSYQMKNAMSIQEQIHLTGTDMDWSFIKGSLTYRQLLLLTPFGFLGLHDARHLDHCWHGLGSHSDTGDNIEADAC